MISYMQYINYNKYDYEINIYKLAYVIIYY